MKGICVTKRLLFINILCLLWLPNFCDIKNEVDNQGVQANKEMPNVISRTDDVPSVQEKEVHEQQPVVNAPRPNVEYVNKVEIKNIYNNDVSKLESPETHSSEKHRQQIVTNLDSSRNDEVVGKKDEPSLKQESLSVGVDSSSDHVIDKPQLENSIKHSDTVLPQASEASEKIDTHPDVENINLKTDFSETKSIPRPTSPVSVKTIKSVTDDNVQHPHYDGMPSFDEWKKMMLAEQEKGGQKPPSPALPGKKISSQKRRRNYSSYECGAKIVASNTEAEGTSRILNELVDEYMLNPCKAKIWFVIELCETVQANQIELANFELFSSCPKDFTVYSSDNFPTRDWVPLGTFTAAEQRILQSFELKQEGFGKFIKIELLSHYGTEHYCPLSVVRIFGTSMVDEYEEMETLSNHVDSTEDDLDRLDIVIEDKKSTNLLGSATDAVMNIVKKAAQALGQHQASEEIKGNETIKDQQNVSEAQLCSVADQSQNKCEQVPITSDSGLVMPTPPQFPILSSSMHHSLFRRLHRCDQCSSRIRYYSSAQPHCRFFQAALGPVVFQALCDWFKEHPVVIAQESSSHRNKVPLPNIDSSISPTKSPPPQVMRVAIENDMPWKKLISNDTIPLGPIDVRIPSNKTYPPLDIIANASTDSDKLDIQDTLEIVSTTSYNESEGLSPTPELSGTIFPLQDTIETTSSQPSQVTPTETTIPEDKPTTETTTVLPSNIDSSGLPDILSESEVEQIAEMSDTMSVMEDVTEPISVTEIPSELKPTVGRPSDVRTEFQGKVEPVGISSVGQKESVFMRMSNRIKALEINMSLSSQYLQELSQRYRRQMEEMQRAFNRTIGTLNDTARKAAERDLKQQDILNNLQLQVANLSQTVEMLMHERSTVFRKMVETHIGLMVIEAIIMITIMSLCVRRISSSAGQIPLPAKETVVATRVSTKRRSSVDSCSPPVARKVKKRSASEEALNAGELLIMEPLPVLLDPMLKAKKKNRRRSKAVQRSNSNPTSKNSSSASHSAIRPTSKSDSYIQASAKPNFLSHEASSRCENCNDNACTATKAPDKERRVNGAPFQNLTNGSVVRSRESQSDNKFTKGKERFSFKKFLKFQKRDSI